jgi:hypothetical protein
MVLDGTMPVQLVEKHAGHPEHCAAVGPRIALAREERVGFRDQQQLHPSEAEVPVEPETGQHREVPMRLPPETRIPFDQHP